MSFLNTKVYKIYKQLTTFSLPSAYDSTLHKSNSHWNISSINSCVRVKLSVLKLSVYIVCLHYLYGYFII